MNYSCGNCKHLRYDKEYLYPYRCRYKKGISLSSDELDERVRKGFKCDKYEFGFSSSEDKK